MTVDTKTKKGFLGLAYGATQSAIPFTQTTVCPNTPTRNDKFAIAFGLLQGPHNFPDPAGRPGFPDVPLPAIGLSFANDFTILGDTFNDPTGIMQIAWDPATPVFVPDPNAARSAKSR